MRKRPEPPASAGKLPPAGGADFSGGEALEGSRLENLGVGKIAPLQADIAPPERVPRAFEAARAEFIECRLTGIAAAGRRRQDVLVEDCDARYAQLSGGRAARCESKAGRPGESGFREANRDGAILTRGEPRGAHFRGAKLRGAGIEAIVVRGEDVRRAIITPDNSMELVRLLGLAVRWLPLPRTRR